MADLREMIQALTPEVPLPLINTRTTANGIDAAGNVWVYQPPEVIEYLGGGTGGPFLPISGGTMQGPLNWIATGSTQPRSAQDRSAEAHNLKDWDTTNGADYSPALNAAIAALSAGTGGKLVLPAGQLICNSAIVATIPAGVTVTIEGMGPGASELYFANATDGLSFILANSGTAWGSVHLSGFTLTRGPTSPEQANTGLSIGVVSGAGYAGLSSLRDLIVQGSASRAFINQWTNSVVLSGLSGTTIDNVTILGRSSAATDLGDILLALSGGPGTPQFASPYKISNCDLIGGSCGIQVSGWVQGVFVNNSVVIGQYDSIRWTGGIAFDAEELAVTNCSLNGGHRGIYLSGVNQCSVSDSTILRYNTGTAGWAGIELNVSNYNTITGNNIIGANTSNEVGILVSNATNGPNTIIGNVTGNISTYSIWLNGNTNATTVVGNTMLDGTAGIVQDSPGNTVYANTWKYVPVATTFQQAVTFANATTGVSRWFVGNDGTTESGGDTGNNFEIVSAHDNGSLIGAPLTIARATGVASFSAIPTAPTAPAGTNNAMLATTAFVANGFLPLSGGTTTGALGVHANTPNWGANNYGSQLLLQSSTGNYPGLGMADPGGSNWIGMFNWGGAGGQFVFAGMPAPTDSTTAPVLFLRLTSAAANFLSPIERNGTQVVNTRIAGWGTSTGGVRGPITASSTLVQVAEGLAQLLTDLQAHGLIGT